MNDWFHTALSCARHWNVIAALIFFPASFFLPDRVGEKRWLLPALVAASAVLLFWGKWMQHQLFQNQAYDLGIFTNTLWNLSHGRGFWDNIVGMNNLGDHFSPVLILLVPFFRLFPSPLTLVFFQSLALALALVPLHALALRRLGSSSGALAVCALFLANPYLHKAHAFDFHPIVFAIPLFLWALAALDQGDTRKAFWLAVSALIIREDAALGVFGLGWVLLLRDKKTRPAGALLMGVGFLWSVLIPTVVMPRWFGSGARNVFFYSYLNPLGWKDGAQVLLHPWKIFHSVLADPGHYRALAAYFSSFAFLPLASPKLAPTWIFPILLGFFSDWPAMHSFEAHYSALSFPFLFYAALGPLERLAVRLTPSLRKIVWAGAVSLSLACVPPYFMADTAAHIRSLRALVAQIPSSASVSAQTTLVPALACRENITLFPRLTDGTEFVALDLKSPMFPPELRADYEGFVLHSRAKIVRMEEGVCLLKKG